MEGLFIAAHRGQLVDRNFRAGIAKASKWSTGLRRPDGEYRWLLDRGTRRFSDDSSFAGYIGSCVDITERKRAEDRVNQVNRALQETNEQMQTLLYAASHDLQEPLRMVGSFVDLLRERYASSLDERGRTYIKYAAERARLQKGTQFAA